MTVFNNATTIILQIVACSAGVFWTYFGHFHIRPPYWIEQLGRVAANLLRE